MKSGDTVVDQQAMFVMHTGRKSSNATASVEQQLIEMLKTRQQTHDSDDITQLDEIRQEEVSLKARQLSIQYSIDETMRQEGIQRSRLELAAANVDRYRDLASKGFVAQPQVREQRDALLQLEAQLSELRRSRLELERDLSATKRSLSALRNRLRLSRFASERARLDLEQQIAENKGRTTIEVAAPTAGVIGGIYAQTGQWASSGMLLATVIPVDSPLVAHLLVPSRAIGFIKAGQLVRLKFQAFPFERFGTLQGEVVSVDSNIVLEQDVAFPLKVSEPVFRVIVSFDKSRRGRHDWEALPLRAGMLLEGDILVEERRIYQWFFRPLLVAVKNTDFR
jgi:membrane fusion protein